MPTVQAATGHRNHESVVAGQQHVDPDDLTDREPEGRSLHVGMELREERADVGGIKHLQQPIHSLPLEAWQPPRAALVCSSYLTDDLVARKELGDLDCG